MSNKRPDAFNGLVSKTALRMDEIEEWRQAAENMYIPYDEKMGIHPQDDAFLDKEVWDLKNTPPESFPLLLFYHPLTTGDLSL